MIDFHLAALAGFLCFYPYFMIKRLYKFFALLIGSAFALLVLEAFLHLYHPFAVTVKHNDIVLPANRVFVFENTHIGQLDRHITCTKNRMGFRGPAPPADLSAHTSILAVGGSTTECRLLNDGHDWPTLTGQKLQCHFPKGKIWMNNAGLDGHSTFGHLILLKNYLCTMHPDYLLFLTGINEMGRDDLFAEDQAIVLSHSFSLTDWLKKNSETIVLANNIYRSIKAFRVDLAHGNLNLNKCNTFIPRPVQVDSLFAAHRPYISAYKNRLETLVGHTIACGARPVLMTQPLLFGNATDPATGVNLATVKTKFFNGKTYWQLLQRYNDATRHLARQMKLPLIDLARQMPKDSRYFYDAMHFTNDGSEKVSDIVYKDLIKILDNQNK